MLALPCPYKLEVVSQPLNNQNWPCNMCRKGCSELAVGTYAVCPYSADVSLFDGHFLFAIFPRLMTVIGVILNLIKFFPKVLSVLLCILVLSQ